MSAGVLLVLLSLVSSGVALSCLGNNNSVIATVPRNDIAVEYEKQPLSIFCMVEPPYNSKQVRFVQRIFNSTDKELSDYTKIINETTVQLYMQYPEKQSSNIECEVKDGRSCMNKVVVDSAPGNVTNFQCRSYNLQRLVCKWRTPVHYAKTWYLLQYDVYGRPNNACMPLHNNDDYNCTLYVQAPDRAHSMGTYRTQEDYYLFTLTSTNSFGNIQQRFEINHYANLIPGKPKSLSKKILSAHSVALYWKIPQDVADFSKGVDTRIKYQIKTVDNLTMWRTANLSGLVKIDNSRYSCVLNGLPYAHWSYDVRVFIKSVLALDEKEFWSDFQATTFTTMSEPPPFPPQTRLGAFVSMKRGIKRDIYVYWQQIDEYYESGNNFTYNVEFIDGTNSQMLLSNKSSYIHFMASLIGINVSIASSNNLGQSREKSYIYIPPDSLLLKQPTSFTKTVYGNKTYDLRWQPPRNTHFDSYTVFWCSKTDVEPCSGKLNFTTLPPNVTSHRVLVSDDDRIYMFAISANRAHLSSGMVWDTCNLPAFNATNRVAVFKRGPAGRRYVELQWDLGCSFSEGHVKGYNISYCPLADPSHCSNADEKSMVIYDPLQKAVNVTELKPHTTYSFHISVIYKDGLGYSSESVDDTTLEDKPSEPVNPRIANVTARTMLISWDPPVYKNGILVEYRINYTKDNNDSREVKVAVDVVEKSAQHKDKRQEYILRGLDPFTYYTVKVSACTTDCSDGIIAGRERTHIGTPGTVENVTINGSYLQWDKPIVPGGDLDRYEIEINSDGKSILVLNSTGAMKVQITKCEGAHTSDMEYRVRAVNYVKKNQGISCDTGGALQESEPFETCKGSWSNPARIQCIMPSRSVFPWIFGIIGTVAFVTMSVFMSRKVWIKIKDMKNIKPVLPAGLGPPMDEKDTINSLGGVRAPPAKKEEKGLMSSISDKALLLPQNHSGGNKDFVSSNDSTDSTTLSLTSKEQREHISLSDDASEASSTREQPSSATEVAVPPVAATTSNMLTYDYKDNYKDHDNGYIVSDDLADSGIASTSLGSPSPCVVPPPMHNIPPGYVIAQDSIRMSSPPHSTMPPPPSQIPCTFPQLPPMPKPMSPENPFKPKRSHIDWNVAPKTTEMQNKKVPSLNPCKPVGNQLNNGYMRHTDKLINKHLNIKSAANEEPAIPDPNMSNDAYCRFGHNSDPSVDADLQ